MDTYKRREFCKSTAKESPLRHKFIAKIRNFDSFEGYIPTFMPL